MKTEIHPKYYESAEIRCSCGNIFYTGSTKESLRTELCSKCHPFYTGQQKLVDTAGMVDKFQARKKAAELHKQAVLEHERLKKIKKEEPVIKPRKPEPKRAPEAPVKKLIAKAPVKKPAAKKAAAKKPAKTLKKPAIAKKTRKR